MKVNMFGKGDSRARTIKHKSPPPRKTLISRMWRLGDIVMCEPVNRIISETEEDVTFSTRSEYHPIVQSFHLSPPSVMKHPLDNKSYGNVIDLDSVSLTHDGYVSKVDAFLARSGLDPSSIPDEIKIPRIDLPERYDSWAKRFLSKRDLGGAPLICVARQSLNERSPRNIPRETLDEVCERLAENHSVAILGAFPMRMGLKNENIHNLTGSTPDVMSTAGVLANSRLLITVDTGLMHVAGAMGVPMITMMGPTRPDDVSSFYRNNTIIHVGRDGCCPCFERGCSDPCMRSITADVIIEMAEERMSNPSLETTVIVP